MNCGFCEHTDNVIYYSLPPKIKCNVTGEYHLPSDECNIEIRTIVDVGEWIKHGWPNQCCYECSICHEEVWRNDKGNDFRYCPYCGSKMNPIKCEEEQNNE